MMLDSIKVKNFKAIRNSGVVKLKPLTVFVGNNGSGKSSLVEALETYQTYVVQGLDEAMQRFMGMEHVQNKYAKPDTPIEFDLRIRGIKGGAKLGLKVATNSSHNKYEVIEESLECKSMNIKDLIKKRDIDSVNWQGWKGHQQSLLQSLNLGKATDVFSIFVSSWQFLSLAPEQMGLPKVQSRWAAGQTRLARDGSNIAEFLLGLRELDPLALDGIIETMAYVLPYARDLQPAITSELERKAWLQLTEGDFKVPGWMLSTGTLRMLALLALLRHPKPPPLIVVEEIENGLDPRSVHLIVEEIRNAVLSGVTQVIVTTHSPYLLDLLKLEHLVVVERDAQGHPRFSRPADQANLQRWAQEFAPGKLYTMGNLTGLDT